MSLPKSIVAKAKKIKLIAMDIDGVLTGGEIIVLNSGEEVKIWNVKDRFGFHLVHRCKCGIKFAWITGRKSEQVALRAKEVGIDDLFQGCMKKDEAVETLAKKYSLKRDEIAFLGDDLVDVPVFRNVGLSVCPADAPADVKNEADYISPIQGGRGVLREVVDIVLKARGLWKIATKGYL